MKGTNFFYSNLMVILHAQNTLESKIEKIFPLPIVIVQYKVKRKL